MLDHCLRFTEIETYIDKNRELNEDALSALWLFAWVETNRKERHPWRREFLDGVSRDVG